MSHWEAAALGIIQGLTEFLPISSTAHLLVARTLMGHTHPEDAFTVVIQLGTLVAVFAFFRQDILKLAAGLIHDMRSRRIGSTLHARLAWFTLLGSVPVGIIGLTLKSWLKTTFYNLPAIAIVSIIFALILAAAELWAHRQSHATPLKGEADITWLDALWVGLWQALALMPGGSRSGTTITGGLFAGLARPTAARFSFLLSLPSILAAGLKDLYDEYKKLQTPDASDPTSLLASRDEVAALLIGTVVSAIVGYLAIAWLLRFLQRYSTAVFIVYRVLLGSAILAWLAT